MWDEVGHSATGLGLSNPLLVPGRRVLLSQRLLAWLLRGGSDVAGLWLYNAGMNTIIPTPHILQKQQLWHCLKVSEKDQWMTGLRSRWMKECAFRGADGQSVWMCQQDYGSSGCQGGPYSQVSFSSSTAWNTDSISFQGFSFYGLCPGAGVESCSSCYLASLTRKWWGVS